jgi:hypothetical protein
MKKIKNNYSISKLLRSKNKSNDYFEILLNNLSLEEIIALKLELSYKAIGFPLHGFPIWKSINYISKDALLKFALCATDTRGDAARMLGLEPIKFFSLLRKFNTKRYFSEEQNDDSVEPKSVEGDIS